MPLFQFKKKPNTFNKSCSTLTQSVEAAQVLYCRKFLFTFRVSVEETKLLTFSSAFSGVYFIFSGAYIVHFDYPSPNRHTYAAEKANFVLSSTAYPVYFFLESSFLFFFTRQVFLLPSRTHDVIILCFFQPNCVDLVKFS